MIRLGPTDDVPGALTDIGVPLSSSVREGCRVVPPEGAAGAAVPVVRDWPFQAGKPNSARALRPERWVVGSAGEAARRILEVTDSGKSRHTAGRLASEHAPVCWDRSVVRQDSDEPFPVTGTDRPRVSGPTA